MRVGSYSQRDDPGLDGYGRHRIVMPVFVPHLEGYFAHALEMLDLCLRSLHATIPAQARLTIVANGCDPRVVERLLAERERGWVDQVLINHANRGKVDAVVGVFRGSFEPYVTVTDADVLFLPGWLQATEDVFRAFPACAAVAPSPNPAHTWSRTSATVLSAMLRGALGWEQVTPKLDLDLFAASIGRPDFFKPEHYASQLVVRNGQERACVGCGHFVLTLHRSVLGAMPTGPSLMAVTGDSEERWLDEPPEQLGHWRLSTPKAWVHHMGNQPEDWMREQVVRIESGGTEADVEARPPLTPPARTLIGRVPRAVRTVGLKVVRRLLRPPTMARSAP